MQKKYFAPLVAGKQFAVFLILFLGCFYPLIAQNFSTVTALGFKGKTVFSAAINVFPPGRGAAKNELKLNDQLTSGTKLVIPANTIVKLQSPGGTQVIRPLQGKPIEYIIELNADGENHIVKGLGAQIINNVKKTIGYTYKNTNGRGTTAASKGTEFTFTDLSGNGTEKASIVTTEGTIHIIDQVPCTINGEPLKSKWKGGTATKAFSQTQSAGDIGFTSSDQAVDYSNYDDAVIYLESEINRGETDPDFLAGNLMCLGDLYMDMNQPEKAIQPYSKAAEYFEKEYGQDDLASLEARLSAAEAYIGINNNRGLAIVRDCIAILEKILDDDEYDLDYAIQNEDKEAGEFICEDIREICEYLGWAYDLAGNSSISESFYKRAESGCE